MENARRLYNTQANLSSFDSANTHLVSGTVTTWGEGGINTKKREIYVCKELIFGLLQEWS